MWGDTPQGHPRPDSVRSCILASKTHAIQPSLEETNRSIRLGSVPPVAGRPAENHVGAASSSLQVEKAAATVGKRHSDGTATQGIQRWFRNNCEEPVRRPMPAVRPLSRPAGIAARHACLVGCCVWWSTLCAGCAIDAVTVSPPPVTDEPGTPGLVADVVTPDPPMALQPPIPPMALQPTDLPMEIETPLPPIETDPPTQPVVEEPPADPPAAESEMTATVAAYHNPQPTNFGVSISCSECHGPDGTGGQDSAGHDVNGIRGRSTPELIAHAQEDASHPAPTGRAALKFPELTPADFDAIAAFLAED